MITSLFLDRANIKSYISDFITDNYDIDGDFIYDQQINPIINILSENISFYFEYPYVDKYYRDSYYNFYSKKHKSYKRNSIRISLFDDSITEDSFFDLDEDKEVKDQFYGYFTIRPTTFKIIGHSFISPKALKNNSFVTCLSNETVLISGKKIKIYGFPYISQDKESITCSESSILNILDYFSNKYANYSLLLPSNVTKILSKHSSERQLPSKGLPTENISFVLKKIGFGTVVYTYDKKSKKSFSKKSFREILFTYIESGIPMIATLSSKQNHHAILIIGRRNIEHEIIASTSMFSTKKYFSFTELFDKILIIDDNQPPYRLVDFKTPIYDKESKSYYKIKSIIVPLYSKIHLEAFQVKEIFFDIVKIIVKNIEEEIAQTEKNKIKINLIPENGKYIFRYFITSSRSYKNYISKSKMLSKKFKSFIIDKSMPKFIWVGEIIDGTTINIEQKVYSVLVLDATESGNSGHLIFATNLKYLIFDNLVLDEAIVNQYHIFEFDNNQILYTFANNLKGLHTKWESPN